MYGWNEVNALPAVADSQENNLPNKLIVVPEVGMETSKFTGVAQNWCVFSPGLYYGDQVESKSQISVDVNQTAGADRSDLSCFLHHQMEKLYWKKHIHSC